MTPDRWQQIEEIFQAALDLTPAAREKFVETKCSGDTELKKEVGKLLSDYDSADSFIESPVWTDSRFLNSSAKDEIENSLDKKLGHDRRQQRVDLMVGRRVGVYELKKEIGRGGMGAVYLAERADGEFRQKVAVKLIKRGMDTDFVLSRFRHERQILANLNHPNIVLLLDGGTTDDGLPYFVMDFVEGNPLHKYCDAEKLSLRPRLELFRQVCEAVNYAHQRKIVHRDLKPSNILVNKDGLPKLLDFGIAKLLDPEQTTDTLIPTETHMRLMTPEYASPEQVSGADITPASDIYSLGVLLYELVTGRRPYKFPTRAPHEVARIICEEEPVKPSQAVAAARDETRNETNKVRNSKIKDLLDGEIDKIILKALRKNPAERYETAAALADDLERFLENRPVKAEFFMAPKKTEPERKESELSIAILPFKFFGVAENETASSSSGGGGDEYLGIGLADSLVTRLSSVKRLIVRPTSSVLRFGETDDPFQTGHELGVDFIVTGNIRRVGERIRVKVQLLKIADRAVRWAENFNENFTDVLELEDSISGKIAASLLPYLTGEERRRLEKRGTNSPEAYEAYLRGRYHWNQFTPDALLKAQRSFQRAIEIDPEYALPYVGLADFYIWANIYGIIPSAEALPLAEASALRAIELDDKLGEAYASLGLTHQNRFSWKKAEKLYKKALEYAPNYVHAHEWFAAQLVGHGKFEEGVAEMKLAERLDPLSLRTKTLTAWTLYQAHFFDEALERGRQIVDLDEHYPQGYSQIGNNLLQLGRIDEAVENYQKFDAMIPNSALAKYALCHALARAGRRSEAEAVLEEVKTLASKEYVKPYFLGMSYAALDKRDEAFANFEKAFEEDDPWMLWFGTEPMLDALRDDHRFVDLLRRMNLPPPAIKPILDSPPGNSPFPNHRQVSEKHSSPPEISNKQTPEITGQDSIAVLPLKMLGGFAPNESGERFLGVGLTDTLIMRLSQLRSFIVRPTSAVMRFNGKDIDPLEAGRELKVRYVLDGNVRRSASQLRVTLQLLDVANKSTVWAEQFNSDPSDIFLLEDEISEQVAKSILPQLSTDEQKQLAKRGTDNIEAYELYLRGRFHWNTFTEEGFAKAFYFYNQAVAVAPDFALVYAGIADYYNLLGLYSIMPFAETSVKAKEAAEKAIALDSDLAEGYAALGFATLMHDFDWAATEKHLKRAVQINPNYVTGRIWYCFFLALVGKFEGSLEQVNYAFRLDPLNPLVSHTQNLTLYFARRFAEAVKTTEKLIEKEPHYALAQLFLSSLFWLIGRTGEAVDLAARAIKLAGRSTYTLPWLASALAADGQIEQSRQILDEIEELSVNRHISPSLLAMVYCNLRETEKALEALERAWEIRDGRLAWLGVEPQFDSLRGEPRFQDLLRRTGNPLQKAEGRRQ